MTWTNAKPPILATVQCAQLWMYIDIQVGCVIFDNCLEIVKSYV